MPQKSGANECDAGKKPTSGGLSQEALGRVRSYGWLDLRSSGWTFSSQMGRHSIVHIDWPAVLALPHLTEWEIIILGSSIGLDRYSLGCFFVVQVRGWRILLQEKAAQSATVASAQPDPGTLRSDHPASRRKEQSRSSFHLSSTVRSEHHIRTQHLPCFILHFRYNKAVNSHRAMFVTSATQQS